MKTRIINLIVTLSIVAFFYFIISTQAQTVQISGYAFKMGQTDHSGIKVILQRTVPSLYNDTIITDASGYYVKTVYSGVYNIKFYNEYFPFPTNYFANVSCYANQIM